jgi:hypothetical protein
VPESSINQTEGRDRKKGDSPKSARVAPVAKPIWRGNCLAAENTAEKYLQGSRINTVTNEDHLLSRVYSSESQQKETTLKQGLEQLRMDVCYLLPTSTRKEAPDIGVSRSLALAMFHANIP